METTTICLPKYGESVTTDDLFVVTNGKDPDFGKIFKCVSVGPENLILTPANKTFHFLNVTKVLPHECTYSVKSGDTVCSLYAVRYAKGVILNYLYGTVMTGSDEANWRLRISGRQKIDVPKKFTFKVLKPLSLNQNDYGVRGIITPGIPECGV